MSQSYAFKPIGAGINPPAANATIAVTTGVQQISLPVANPGVGTMRLVVDGTQKVAWAYGATAGLTMANGIGMLPNTVEVFDLPPSITQLSVIAAATGSNFSIVVGDGV